MEQDWFQERRSDLFQENFLPCRQIPAHDISEMFPHKHVIVKTPGYTLDLSNTSPWITAIYRSQFHAANAAKQLPGYGLNIYYPRCRFKEKEIVADWELKSRKRAKEGKSGERFVAAYGRYLFIQLPEDQDTFANLDVSEEFLSGRFNENGLVEIMSSDDRYSLTTNLEIMHNREFHAVRNRLTDPKINLRFAIGEVVRVAKGNLHGYLGKLAYDVMMSVRLKTKVQLILGSTGAKHYVQLGYLEKV